MIDNIYTCQNIMPISELFRTAALYCASAVQACKLLFFVKNKGQWNAKSGPKVGDGKVAM